MLESIGGVISGKETNMVDPFTGALILGGLSAGAGILQNHTNAEAIEATNKANLQATRETNAQNLELTRQAWARDDNAVQRRTADLRAAGMSPLLAAGSSAGNTNPATMSAPQFAAKKYDYSTMMNGINQGIALAQSSTQQAATEQQISLSRTDQLAKIQEMALKARMTDAQITLMEKQGYGTVTSANAQAQNAYTNSEQFKLKKDQYDRYDRALLQIAIGNAMSDWESRRHNLDISRSSGTKLSESQFADNDDTRATFGTIFSGARLFLGK